MVVVTIISKPQIDLEIFFKAAEATTGRRVTRAIDSTLIPLVDTAKFISALAEFSDSEKDSKATYNIQKAEHELFFLYYVFACYASVETCNRIREWTKLDVTSYRADSGSSFFLLGGSLYEWVRATTKYCVTDASYDLRLLFDKIILLFEKEGLGNVWFDYRKKTLDDQTFLLEDKR